MVSCSSPGVLSTWWQFQGTRETIEWSMDDRRTVDQTQHKFPCPLPSLSWKETLAILHITNLIFLFDVFSCKDALSMSMWIDVCFLMLYLEV